MERSYLLNSETSAPICGTPAEFRTDPAMLPESLAGVTHQPGAALRSKTAIAPILDFGRTLIFSDGTSRLVPQCYFTVKFAVGVRTSFLALSVTFIFSEYWPGSSEPRGRSFSTVTCCADAPGKVVTS